MKTAKLIGGAGTGKTHRLMVTLDRLLDTGVDPLDVGFVTFTRAARAEAVARAADRLSVPPAKLERKGWFRTLHSICYRLLGVDGELLTDNAASRKWVQDTLSEPVERLDGDWVDSGLSGGREVKTAADAALGLWATARNRLEPVDEVWGRTVALSQGIPPLAECLDVIERYEAAKRADDRCDFTDLLLRVAGYRCWSEGVERTEPEGELPDLVAWIHDEAQDCSALTWAVFQRLIHTARCRYVYVASDPYQAIYSFAGSDSRHFLGFEADKTEIMGQSHRCPDCVLGLGERLLADCADYFDRHINPAPHDGLVDECTLSDLPAAIDPHDDWLILARSNRLVTAIGKQLDGAGVPWRQTRGKGGWAPSIRTRAIRTLAAMQRGEPIRVSDWVDVVKALPAKGRLIRGTKRHWTENVTAEQLRTMPLVTRDDWPALGLTDDYAGVIQRGDWTADVAGAATYLQAVRAWGQDAVDKPGVRVGTVHSVKGAEAENVALLTTLPAPAARALGLKSHRDAEQRVFYVGATRAGRRLLLLTDPMARYKKRLPV